MSGFEVAGLVLGAIPIALELLKHYEDAAKRPSYWRKIQVDYLQCKGELELQALLFKKNLRKLLLPLDIGEAEMGALLTNPNDPAWKDRSVEVMLEARLQDTYRHYLEYVKRLEQTMESLKVILAVDSVGVQGRLGRSRDPWTLKGIKTKVLDLEWWGYEKYRIRFANSAKERHRLLEELDAYNSKLERLLRTSDEDTRLVMDREHAISDNKLCSFWIQATQTYTALASHWDCGCDSQADHTVRVSLEHPQVTQYLKLAWLETTQQRCSTCYLHISKADSLLYSHEKMITHQPDPQSRPQPKKSAMKSKQLGSGQNTRPAIPSVKIAETPIPPAIEAREISKISTICASIHANEKRYAGYVTDESSIYYIHQEPKPGNSPIALEGLLRSRSGQPPSFRQRCRISLAVASSFMQLLETPWMPHKAQRPEIVFAGDEEYYNPELVFKYSALLRGSYCKRPVKSSHPFRHFWYPFYAKAISEMMRARANDGSAFLVRAARSSTDPFIATANRTTDAPRTWFSLNLHNLTDPAGELNEEILSRTKAWVEDQKLIAFGGYLLMKARERRRRFRDQERHPRDAARAAAFKDQFRAAAEQAPRMVQEAMDGSLGVGGEAAEEARREAIRQVVGRAGLYLGALEMEKLVEEYDCECDGSESASESASEVWEEEEEEYHEVERGRKRQRVAY
ncbi:hypothetical protein PG997_011534 [Apiospora hydei]|uniref:Prion-inhibition and propagation HeLo domain-containing protein n=1 Tax=Apiospora hydei TaxID=1337664 RepID=A0ABR1VM05_9PEZI